MQLPAGGCPGPHVVDFASRLRLVVLDTQWWLHGGEKPGAADCDPGTEDAVVDALKRSVAGASERRVVVDETLYRRASAGFVRLDVLRDGRLRLGVLTVDAEAKVSEPFAIYLQQTSAR